MPGENTKINGRRCGRYRSSDRSEWAVTSAEWNPGVDLSSSQGLSSTRLRTAAVETWPGFLGGHADLVNGHYPDALPFLSPTVRAFWATESVSRSPKHETFVTPLSSLMYACTKRVLNVPLCFVRIDKHHFDWPLPAMRSNSLPFVTTRLIFVVH